MNLSRVRVLFSKRPGLLKILILFLIIAAIPLTVIIAQRQQEIRQRASGPVCAVDSSRYCDSDCVLSFGVPIGQQYDCAAGKTCCATNTCVSQSGRCDSPAACAVDGTALGQYDCGSGAICCKPAPPTSTHHACVNQTCQTVAGGGSNTCSSNQDCIVTNTPTGTPNTSGTFTFNRLPSATLQPGNAKFYFTYSGTSNNYKIHLSSSPTFASDIYFDFAQGAGTLNDINILITETTNADPAKYASYVCNKTLYWKVVSATGVESSIQSATVAGSSCPPPTAIPTPTCTPLAGDFDRNCCIDDRDFDVWKSNYIAGSGGLLLADYNVWFSAKASGINLCALRL